MKAWVSRVRASIGETIGTRLCDSLLSKFRVFSMEKVSWAERISPSSSSETHFGVRQAGENRHTPLDFGTTNDTYNNDNTYTDYMTSQSPMVPSP